MKNLRYLALRLIGMLTPRPHLGIKGFTVIELIFLITLMGALSVVGLMLYTLYHFISKVW